MTWTIDFVEQQAPDSNSIRAGHSQTNPMNWKVLAISTTDQSQVIWGEVKGRDSRVYHTQIDLGGPAFNCTCPSRKFPCKHGIGLGLIYAQNPQLFYENPMPNWVNTWIQARQKKSHEQTKERSEQSVQGHQTNHVLSIEQQDAIKKKALAKAKRLEGRIKKVSQGLFDLECRLQDTIRNGLVSIKDPYMFWDQIGARLVDAQASALAKRVRLIPIEAQSPQEVLREIAYLHLVCQAWARREHLSVTELADLKTVIGFTVSQDELMHQVGQSDHWLLLSIEKEQEQQLSVLKQWFYGIETGQVFMLLSYAFYNQPHPYYFNYAQVLQAELCVYEGHGNQRASLKTHLLLNHDQRAALAYSDSARQANSILNPHHGHLRGFIPLCNLLEEHARTLAKQPWLSQRAYLIKEVLLCQSHEGLFAYSRADDDEYLKLQMSEDTLWQVLAMTGAQPAHYLGLWHSQKQTLTLLSLVHGGRIYPLG